MTLISHHIHNWNKSLALLYGGQLNNIQLPLLNTVALSQKRWSFSKKKLSCLRKFSRQIRNESVYKCEYYSHIFYARVSTRKPFSCRVAILMLVTCFNGEIYRKDLDGSYDLSLFYSHFALHSQGHASCLDRSGLKWIMRCYECPYLQAWFFLFVLCIFYLCLKNVHLGQFQDRICSSSLAFIDTVLKCFFNSSFNLFLKKSC